MQVLDSDGLVRGVVGLMHSTVHDQLTVESDHYVLEVVVYHQLSHLALVLVLSVL